MEASSLLIETQYFPPIRFFEQAARFPYLLLESAEHYQKGSYRNRCLIAGPNGLQRLSVPLTKGKNAKTSIKEVKIAYEENWQKHQWQAIQTAYGKSPFFEFYSDDLRPIFAKKFSFLFDLNLEIIDTLGAILQLSFAIQFTEEYNKDYPAEVSDFRNKISPKTKSDTTSIHSTYPQVFEAKNGFLSNLSILDLLFCLGPEAYYYLSPKQH